MALDLEKILRKRKPRGVELGRVVLLCAVHDFFSADPKAPFVAPKPLVDPKKLERLAMGIPTEGEWEIYSAYNRAVDGLARAYENAEGSRQQAQSGYYYISSVLRDILNAERTSKIMRRCIEITGDSRLNEPLSELGEMFPSLEQIANRPEDVLKVEHARDVLMLGGFRELFCFNRYIEILSEVTKVSEVGDLKIDVTQLYGNVKELNSMADALKTLLKNSSVRLSLADSLFPRLEPALIALDAGDDEELYRRVSAINSGGSLLRIQQDIRELAFRMNGKGYANGYGS